MAFFACIVLQLGSGFDRIMGNLRTIGSRCRIYVALDAPDLPQLIIQAPSSAWHLCVDRPHKLFLVKVTGKTGVKESVQKVTIEAS